MHLPFFEGFPLFYYPKKEIKIPAATADPITPATLDDIQ